MATKVLEMPHRGSVYAIITQNETMIYACKHKTDNLGIYAVSGHEAVNKSQTQLYQLSTPHPIVDFCKIGDERIRYSERQTEQSKDIIFAIDSERVLYRLPDLSTLPVVEDAPDIIEMQTPVQKVPLSGKVKFAEMYSQQELLLLLEVDTSKDNPAGELVVIYDIEEQKEVYSLIPEQLEQQETSTEKENIEKENIEEENIEEENTEENIETQSRLVTAIAAYPQDGRFAIGFSDGLFEHYKPTETPYSFSRQRLLSDDRSGVRETLHADAEVKALLFVDYTLHQEGFDEPSLYTSIISCGLDNQIFEVNVSENLPRTKVASNKGHKKNIEKIFGGFGNFFYTTSRDNTLMMCSRKKGQSGNNKIHMPFGPGCLGRFLEINNRGEKLDTPFFIRAQDETITLLRVTDPKIVEPQTLKEEEQLEDDHGKIQTSYPIQINGLKQWLTKAYKSDRSERRLEIIRLAGSWKDNVAVYFLRDAIFSETNPKLVEEAIVLLYETKHPKMPLILEYLLGSDEYETCWQVIKYLRDIYGTRDLYPLDLAFESSHIIVRERALREYAVLAKDPSDDNIHQYAFEKVYAALHDIEQIQEIAFELLCSGNDPLYPGVKGIMYALTSSDESIQLRALDLLYHNDLIESPDSKDDASDLLRQIRESDNSKLRYNAYLLSLTVEEKVLTLLRNLDKDVHIKITDLEDVSRNAQLQSLQNLAMTLNASIMDVFEKALSTPSQSKVSASKIQELQNAFESYISEPSIRNLKDACEQYPSIIGLLSNKKTFANFVDKRTIEYCIETFPFDDATQKTFSDLIYLSETAPPVAPTLDELTEDDLSLLQEMASSFHPEISSLGTLAQAKLGMMSALPTLLLLCNEQNTLYRSRAVDGLLEFMDQPVVRQKLHDLLLTAPNIATINPSADKAGSIQAIVQNASYTISRSIAQQIITLIFEDGVYSSSERRVVRSIFESHEYTWSAGAQVVFLNELKHQIGHDSEINIRAKIFRALWKWYDVRGDHLTLLQKTQNSDFDDVRSTSVSRIQECIAEKMAKITDTESVLSDKDWQSIKDDYQKKIENLDEVPFFDATVSLVGVPREVQTEVMLLNKTLHWRGNDLVKESLKTYLNKKLIYLDSTKTRSRLIQLSIYDVFSFLCERIYTNIQASVTKGVEKPWFWDHVEEILNLHNENWALEFYNGANAYLSQPKNEEEFKLHRKGYALPVEIKFEKLALCSRHENVRAASLRRILSQFNQPWVVPVLLEFFMDEVPRLRRLPLGYEGRKVLERQQKIKDAALVLFQHQEPELVAEGLSLVKANTSIIDREIIEGIFAIIDDVNKVDRPIDKNFIATHILQSEFVVNIPEPETFSADLEQKFFEKLRDIFVYETIEDIQHELDTYETKRKTLQKEVELLDAERKRLDESTDADTKAKQLEDVSKRKKSAKTALQKLKKPKPLQDERFLSVVELLSYARGSWAVGWFDDFMSRSDEQLSDHAFDASFIYHARKKGDVRTYIESLLQDKHPRLDDIVQKVFSLTEKWRREVITKILRLNRIDLVFSAFDELCKEPQKITTKEWNSMLDSPYEYIRLYAYQALLGRNELQNPIEHLRKLIYAGRPELRFKGLRSDQIKKLLKSRASLKNQLKEEVSFDASTRVQLFMSSAGPNSSKIAEILRFEYKIPPSRINRIFSSSDSIVISKVKLTEALELQERLENYGATVYICEEHANYYSATLGLWRDVMSRLLIHIRDNIFEDDTTLYEDLRFFEESSRPNQWSEENLRKRSIQALGSVTPAQGHEYLHELLSDPSTNIQQTVALSLIRCRQEAGLEYFFSNQQINDRLKSSLISGILCCGEVAESYVRKLVLGYASDDLIEDMFWLWLLQRSQIGGSLSLLTSILSSHHKHSPLIAAKLFGFVYDQKDFAKSVHRLLGLSKIKMHQPVEKYAFTNAAQWLLMMTDVREKYQNAKGSLAEGSKKKTAKTLKREQWMELASLLASTNGRIRYRASDFVQQVLDGRKTVKEITSFIASFTKKSTPMDFEPLTINEREFSKLEASQFSFGSLAGLIRSNQNSLSIRRKAFRYIVHLSRRHNLRSISGVLSVLFQSSYKVLREDALTLGLLSHKELGLEREEIIRLALNGVAWRNQNMNPATSVHSYDSINYMIISEFHVNGEHDRILKLISSEPHAIAEIAMQLLLKYQEKGNGPFSYRIPSLKEGLISKNINIRRDIVQTIDNCLYDAKQEEERNKQNPKDPTNFYGGSEVYIQLFISGLTHGLKDIREACADKLIRETRHEVLDYVYQNWLKSKDASDQQRACDVLTSFKPPQASSKILQRFLQDPTETANANILKNALIKLDTYNKEDEVLFFDILDGWNEGQRGSQEAFDLLAHFSGYTQEIDPQLEYRNWIMVGLLKEMLNQSRYPEIKFLLYALKDHPVSEGIGIDEQLEKISLIKYNDLTKDIRLLAVKECGRRYKQFTPDFDQPEDAKSTYNGWKHLRNALFQNYNFHPVRAKLGKEISTYAFEAACAIVSRRGYPSYPFGRLKKVLDDTSGLYSYQWKERSLDILGNTRSQRILHTLLGFVGFESSSNPSHNSLFTKSLYLLRYYVTSIPDLKKFVLHMWTLGENRNIRSQVLDTLQFYTDIEIADYDYPTEFTKKLLNWHDTPSMGWLNILIYLYDKLENHQLKLKVNTAVQKTAFVLNINKAYSFYSSNIENGDLSTKDISFDLEIYKNKFALFLTEAHFDLLHKRIQDHGLVDDYLSLLRFSIPKGQSDVPTYLTQLSEKGVRKKLSGLPLSFHSSYEQLQGLILSLRQYAGQNSELDVVYQEIVRHLNNSSPTYQITVEEFKRLPVWNWVDEVNLWENEINIEVGGLDLYAKLLLTELYENFEIYDSVLDMVVKYRQERRDNGSDLQDDEIQRLTDIVTGLRKQWEEFQRRLRRGEQVSRSEINKFEHSWIRSFEILTIIEAGKVELEHALGKSISELNSTRKMETFVVPKEIVFEALSLYLNPNVIQHPDQNLLLSVYKRFPEKRDQLLRYFSIEQLTKIILEEWNTVHVYERAVQIWADQIDLKYKNRLKENMFWVGYLSSHQKFLQLPEFESFLKLLQVIPTNDEKEIRNAWRECDRNLIYVPLFAKVIGKLDALYSKVLVKFNDGWPLFQTLQLIHAHKLSPYKEQIDADGSSTKVFVLPDYVDQIKQVLSLSFDENLQKALREQDDVNNQNHQFMTQVKTLSTFRSSNFIKRGS